MVDVIKKNIAFRWQIPLRFFHSLFSTENDVSKKKGKKNKKNKNNTPEFIWSHNPLI